MIVFGRAPTPRLYAEVENRNLGVRVLPAIGSLGTEALPVRTQVKNRRFCLGSTLSRVAVFRFRVVLDAGCG